MRVPSLANASRSRRIRFALTEFVRAQRDVFSRSMYHGELHAVET